jgi:hypothetical protein
LWRQLSPRFGTSVWGRSILLTQEALLYSPCSIQSCSACIISLYLQLLYVPWMRRCV